MEYIPETQSKKHIRCLIESDKSTVAFKINLPRVATITINRAFCILIIRLAIEIDKNIMDIER